MDGHDPRTAADAVDGSADEDARRTTTARVLALVSAFALLVAAAAFLLTRTDERTATGVGTVDGIELQAFDGDGTVSLASYGGRPLVVNYWASWCTFCIEEMPDFQSVYREVSEDVSFLGIDLQDSPDLARRLAVSTGVTYDLAADPDATSFNAVGAVGMPTTLFVDDSGRILERFTGPMDAEALRSKIDEHFSV